MHIIYYIYENAPLLLKYTKLHNKEIWNNKTCFYLVKKLLFVLTMILKPHIFKMSKRDVLNVMLS